MQIPEAILEKVKTSNLSGQTSGIPVQYIQNILDIKIGGFALNPFTAKLHAATPPTPQ